MDTPATTPTAPRVATPSAYETYDTLLQPTPPPKISCIFDRLIKLHQIRQMKIKIIENDEAPWTAVLVMEDNYPTGTIPNRHVFQWKSEAGSLKSDGIRHVIQQATDWFESLEAGSAESAKNLHAAEYLLNYLHSIYTPLALCGTKWHIEEDANNPGTYVAWQLAQRCDDKEHFRIHALNSGIHGNSDAINAEFKPNVIRDLRVQVKNIAENPNFTSKGCDIKISNKMFQCRLRTKLVLFTQPEE